MKSYIARRLLAAVVLVWAVASLVFFAVRLLPGDVVEVLLAEGGAAPELVAARRRALGLDRPAAAQYGEWLQGVSRLDLGTSLATQRPISPDVSVALPRTLELIVAALVLGAVIGMPVGVLAAVERGTRVDVLISAASLVGLSVPNFVTATLLVLTFGLALPWFPTAGYVGMWEAPVSHLRFLALPAITLGLAMAATAARFTRSSMLDVLAADYVRTAYAKGLSTRRVRYRHALRNALIPVVTVLGAESGALLGGTVIVEHVFNWPGLSTLLIQGASRRDYPMIQAVVLVVAVLFSLLNLAVDIANAAIDPRVRYS